MEMTMLEFEIKMVNELHELAVALEKVDHIRSAGLGEIVIQALAMFYDEASPDDFAELHQVVIQMGGEHHKRWQSRRLFESPVATGDDHARE